MSGPNCSKVLKPSTSLPLIRNERVALGQGQWSVDANA